MITSEQKAIRLIEDFLVNEYEYSKQEAQKEVNKNIANIGLAYTENDEGEPIQISLNLISRELIIDVYNQPLQIKKYNSVDDLIDNELLHLDFNELVQEYL